MLSRNIKNIKISRVGGCVLAREGLPNNYSVVSTLNFSSKPSPVSYDCSTVLSNQIEVIIELVAITISVVCRCSWCNNFTIVVLLL